MSKPKLELTWVGKDQRPRLEPRILLADPAKSYHAAAKVTDQDFFDNKLIFGDNLLALKALEREYAGKVKCVFIDPPYNTGSAFTHYDDGLEHSIWLGLMRDRLEIIRNLLSDDGSLWITIDDNEAHYLKVMCDEIFGRRNFITSFIWRKVDSPNDNKGSISPDHEYVFCFTKNIDRASLRAKQDDSILAAYRSADSESDKPYRDRLLKKNGKNSLRVDRPSMFFPIIAPDGSTVFPVHEDGQEARWAMGQKTVDDLISQNALIWKFRDVQGQKKWVPYTREYAPDTPKRPWQTIWNDLDTTRQTKAHQKLIFGASGVFDTPKPEDLISRIITITTNEGDIVLDSFAGSGTTGAVAHKMRRRWIMVELGEHCHTHIIPRLQKVIDGTDQGGVTEATGWIGGGGFQYYKLAPSLMEQDQWGNWIINREYNKEMLCEALCKIEGYTYAPSDTHYWQHGQGSETDFIYVTTQTLSDAQLNVLSEAVGEGRSLLIIASAWRCPNLDKYLNLTLKKIPNSIAKACEWGRDDYSLNVENLPMSQPVAKAKTHSNNSNSKDSSSKVRAKPINDHMDELFEGDA